MADRDLQVATVFRVGDWRIDGNALTATRGRESRLLEPRAYKVLCYLAERPGQLVTIDELMDAHWEGAVVTPNAVTRVIAQLRKALDDDARNPTYIETVARTGYRCIAPVAINSSNRPRNLRWGIALVAAALLLSVWQWLPDEPAAKPRIAVLPFKNLTGDAALDYLGEGLSEELISTLAGIPGLTVSTRSRSFKYREAEPDLQRLARDLGATYVVNGSVRQHGDDLRLSAQLVDPESGDTVWSQTLEYDMARLFDGQQALAQAAASAAAENSGIGFAASEATPPRAPDPAAYQLYLRGRYVWHRRGSEPLQPAIDNFQEAVSIDPDFARGWSALATAYVTYPSYSPRGYRTWAQAEVAARKAMDLDPELAEPYAVLATFAKTRFRWADSEALFRAGIRRDPDNATARFWYAEFLHSTGQFAAAANQVARAIDLDPTYQQPRVMEAILYMEVGSSERAANELQRLWAAGHQSPLSWMANFMLGLVRGDEQAAREWLAVAQLPAEQKQLIARCLDVEFRGADDATLGKDLINSYWQRPDYPIGIWLASRVGNDAGALELLNYRLDQGRLLETRPLWSPHVNLGREPGTVALLERIGLVDYWRQSAWGEICIEVNDQVSCDPRRLSVAVLQSN